MHVRNVCASQEGGFKLKCVCFCPRATFFFLLSTCCLPARLWRHFLAKNIHLHILVLFYLHAAAPRRRVKYCNKYKILVIYIAPRWIWICEGYIQQYASASTSHTHTRNFTIRMAPQDYCYYNCVVYIECLCLCVYIKDWRGSKRHRLHYTHTHTQQFY